MKLQIRAGLILTLASGPVLWIAAQAIEALQIRIALMAQEGLALPRLSAVVAELFGLHRGIQSALMAAVWGAMVLWLVVCSRDRRSAVPGLRFLYGFAGIWLLVAAYAASMTLAFLLIGDPMTESLETSPPLLLAIRALFVGEVVLVAILIARSRRTRKSAPES